MNRRLITALATVAMLIGFLIYSAVQNTASAVVTVDSLVTDRQPRKKIRLGARVTEDKIDYQTTPQFQLRFTVRDVLNAEEKVPVIYRGIMPDTFQAGRDVILEGNFDGQNFEATSLLTQCPSKYEPPIPGMEKKSG